MVHLISVNLMVCYLYMNSRSSFLFCFMTLGALPTYYVCMYSRIAEVSFYSPVGYVSYFGIYTLCWIPSTSFSIGPWLDHLSTQHRLYRQAITSVSNSFTHTNSHKAAL